MPFDGSGNYLRNFPPGGWQGDAAANIKIKADRHDQHDADLASALSNMICKDGQSSPSADIPFNNKKITNLADPVADQDAVTKKFILGSASTQGLFTKVGFTSADMSLVGRAAGAPVGSLQRIAFNDKADATGNDVFVVNDDGTVSSRAADGTQKRFAPMTAEARNRIVNGAMQISQENGTTAGVTRGYYAADQWNMDYDAATTGSFGFVRPAAGPVTMYGSKYRVAANVNTADASLAAADYWTINTIIEGVRIADFQWGTASAKQVILRFGFRAPAGTYSISLKNSGGTRSYVQNFTISAGQANADTEQTFVIPGDTTGTWLTDANLGIALAVTLAVGTTRQGVAGWQAGNINGTSSNTNGMATVGNFFYLSDVGLYLDPLKTGVAPPWVMPDEAEEMAACQRYWQRFYNIVVSSGYAVSNQNNHFSMLLPVAMRTTPGISFSNFTAVNGINITQYISSNLVLNFYYMTQATGYSSLTFTAVLSARM